MSARRGCSIRGAKGRAWSRGASLWQRRWVWGSYAVHGGDSSECKEVCREPQENERHMDTQQSWRQKTKIRRYYGTLQSTKPQPIYSYPTTSKDRIHNTTANSRTLTRPSSVGIDVYWESTDLRQNLHRQQRMSRAVWTIINKCGPVLIDLRHIPLDQSHRSDWTWPAELGVLPGQQLAEGAVDLPHPYTDCRVAAAVEIDIPGEVHCRRVGMAQVGHYYTVQEGPPVMPPEIHWAVDRTEGWQRKGSSQRNWRGRALAVR
jgi:hypothetical protein